MYRIIGDGKIKFGCFVTPGKNNIEFGWCTWHWFRKRRFWFFRIRFHNGFFLSFLGFFFSWWKRR